MYDLKDTVPLGVDVLDVDGDPTAAGSVVLTIDLPDGTTVTPAVGSPTTGRYEVDFVPTMPGRHAVRWVSTDPSTEFNDVFDVRPQSPRYMISLAQAKRHLNLTTAEHDEELRGHIEAVTAAIELYLHETVVRRSVVEKHVLRRPGSALMLEQHPVVSLTSVQSLDGATTWDLASLDVDTDTGLLSTITGRLSGTVVVTYVAGRSIIPANYSRAAELVVEEMFGPQRAAGAGPPGSPGGGDEREPNDYGVVIPPMAVELLGVSAPLVG